ncbi:MAG TPA: selenide, water dikinase SelD, partial [Limnochordia bacterium]|nr:selenide, water dikinase SelD [Limnochordia bacterium]
MDPEALGQALKGLPSVVDPNVLIGAATADDAAVYKISDELAIVATVDFFTPIVDDPRLFGRIAATNALSDIYAMGARPVFALNLAAFPAKTLPIAVLSEILAGGAEVAQAAGVSLLGGHTIEDAEPKYGLCAIGFAHPGAIWPNAAGAAGDALVLTKGLGTGIITPAMKAEAAPEPAVQAAITAMTTSNRQAAEIAAAIGGVHACTDVTGFGLLGHLREMVLGAGLSARLDVRRVPLLQGARELAEADFAPGGSERNLAFVR